MIGNAVQQSLDTKLGMYMIAAVHTGEQGSIPALSEQSSEILPARPVALDQAGTLRWWRPYGACFLIIGLSFATDAILPRGATAAIGYCLVPVLAGVLRRLQILVILTAICTLLTWVGYFLEPAGGFWWASAFDRAMVTAVLWLTLLLVWRRIVAQIAAAKKAEALRVAVQELRRSNAELQDFSSVISHDIRGPLASISLAASILSKQPAVQSDEKCNEWTDSIVAEVSHVCNLIERLLDYARVGADKIELSECNCETVFDSVRQSLRAELENAGAELAHDPLPSLRADPALMAELFQNLIENSIKYCGSNRPRIHVSATPTKEGWLFSVRDNGLGMSASDAARVFDRFYQAAQCSDGIGLGLATCKRIVERHGGYIGVQSEPGRGSTFSFLIPNSGKT